MSELALKMNTTDLANYASISSLSPYLKLDFNQLQVPKIVLTDENVGPPITLTNSIGSRLVLYNLHKKILLILILVSVLMLVRICGLVLMELQQIHL